MAKRPAHRADAPSVRPRVLFLGHGAERTGPPVLLLRLCRWLRENIDMDVEFVLLEGGPMLAEFEALGNVHVLDDVEPRWTDRIAVGIARRARLDRLQAHLRGRHLRRRLRETAPPSVVYVNTAGSVHALRHLRDDRPVVSHVHELSVGLEHFLPRSDLELLVERTDRFLVVSDAVRSYVESTLRIPPDDLELQPGFIDPPVDKPRPPGVPWPDGAFVIGACGSTGWRKAPDLLLAVAAELHHQRPELEVHFAWLGGATGEGSIETAVRRDADALGLDRSFHFLGPVDDPTPWFTMFDVFALTSREDAFPLVGLEAAAARLPIVCFDRGGLPELVNQSKCGFVVPFPDVGAFARSITTLIDEPDTRAHLGSAGRRHVLRNYTTSVRAPAIARSILAMEAGVTQGMERG